MLKNVNSNTGFISLDEICYYPDTYEGNTVYIIPVFCAELPITSNEFFNAGIIDIRASVSLVADAESDNISANRIMYKGKVYAVYRRYMRSDGMIQLYCSEKSGVS